MLKVRVGIPTLSPWGRGQHAKPGTVQPPMAHGAGHSWGLLTRNDFLLPFLPLYFL